MFIDFNKIFFPTDEQINEQIKLLLRIYKESVRVNGKACCNCSHNIYVQESPYNDRLDCDYGYINVCDGCDRWEESKINAEKIREQLNYFNNKKGKD